MCSILIVCEDACLLHAQAGRLDRAGHRVELAPDVFRARDRLSGDPCDVVVIDVRSPDGGMGLLIEQARAAWPGCAVMALVERPDVKRSKVHEMGLWTPDATLVHPVPGERLVREVAKLSGQARSAGDPAAKGSVL